MQDESRAATEKTTQMLGDINQAIGQKAPTHGLNPDDISCKSDINMELEKFRAEAKATRVSVWSFHNGNYFTTGNPQRKLTTVFEATPPDKDVGAEYDMIRGELLNGFAVVLKHLSLGAIQNKGGYHVEPGMTVFSACERCPMFKSCSVLPSQRPHNCVLRCDIDDMPMCSRFYRVMKTLGTKIWYGRTICDEDGTPIGVVTVHFDKVCEEAETFLQDCSHEWCDVCTRLVNSISYLHDLD